MLTHSTAIWHYLGSFLFYTLLTVGLLYGIFWYLKKSPLMAAQNQPAPTQESAPESPPALETEAVLPLEANKNVYIIRSGTERFLVATTTEGIQLLSKLSSVDEGVNPALMFHTSHENTHNSESSSELSEEALSNNPQEVQGGEPAVEIPWFAHRYPNTTTTNPEAPQVNASAATGVKKGSLFGSRFIQSIQWLVSSRFK